MEMYTIQDFPIEKYRERGYQKRGKGNQGKKAERTYRDIIITFDIEASLVPFTDQSIMYIWQMQVGGIGTIIGRTWDEYKEMMKMLILDMPAEHYIVVYVHNLSYEFQFLAGIYEFKKEEVFAVKSRKVLRCDMFGAIEYRCSYLLTNNNLENFTKNMKVEHVKKPGEDLEYDVYRTPDTKLTDKQLTYCQNDVLGLWEALTTKMEKDGDNLYTIPMTSTGYVRRDTKAALRYVNHGYIKKQIASYELYILLREAFRGGNTHANRFFANQILYNVHSWDRSSSYPDVQCNEEFPVAEFKKTYTDVKKLLKDNKPFVCRCKFTKIILKDSFWPIPYLTKDKGRNIENELVDNGRILSADTYETTATDVDMRIIYEEYTFETEEYTDIWVSKYGKLPPAYIHNIEKYFRQKTELKGTEDEYNYMKSKNLLNSIYGMSAQDPIKQSIDYLFGNFAGRGDPPEEIYNKYIKKAYMPYQWGVWTTALARKALEEGIKIAGHDCVYVDTDSVKYIGDADFSTFNQQAVDKSKKSHAYAKDAKGEIHYMGVYEQERTYTKFKTMGAKKYIYQYDDGIVHCTIAGVNKKEGGQELMERAAEIEKETGKKVDPFDLLKEGFVFKKAGGNEVIYNDFPEEKIYYNNKEMEITRNESIIESEYTVGLTAEYQVLLSLCGKESVADVWDLL